MAREIRRDQKENVALRNVDYRYGPNTVEILGCENGTSGRITRKRDARGNTRPRLPGSATKAEASYAARLSWSRCLRQSCNWFQRAKFRLTPMPFQPNDLRISGWPSPRCPHTCGRMADFQQSNRIEHRVRTQVHVALRDREITMTGELLIALGGTPRIARCEQNV